MTISEVRAAILTVAWRHRETFSPIEIDEIEEEIFGFFNFDDFDNIAESLDQIEDLMILHGRIGEKKFSLE